MLVFFFSFFYCLVVEWTWQSTRTRKSALKSKFEVFSYGTNGQNWKILCLTWAWSFVILHIICRGKRHRASLLVRLVCTCVHSIMVELEKSKNKLQEDANARGRWICTGNWGYLLTTCTVVPLGFIWSVLCLHGVTATFVKCAVFNSKTVGLTCWRPCNSQE